MKNQSYRFYNTQQSSIQGQAKRGFTLIELLVVIAIIAILAAILFPVFARARENARKTSCMSNMKQIGLGTMQYTQDYDEFLPDATYGPSSLVTDPKWMDVIYPYVKSEQLFTCPSDSGANRIYNSNRLARTTNAYGSYAINNCYYDSNEPYPPRASNIARIPQTSETIWLTDVSDQDVNPTFFWRPNNANPTIITSGSTKVMQNRNASTTFNYGVSERHLETTPVLFCDGHVKALKIDALTQRGVQLTANFPAGGAYRLFTIDED
ncbi:DUF1559 domain-containing protein [bacterium]|nr:MAG: DUF1559 domain-containing protein [bacterium]